MSRAPGTETAELRARLREVLGEAYAELGSDALRRLVDARLAELDAAGGRDAARADEDAGDEPPLGRFGMIGCSAKMRAVYDLVERVAPSDVPVLIRGETGTGKELVAQALHAHGKRRAKPLLAENCAAVSPNLLESELFGHKKGSFTGAVADRKGHFEVADGGTVFLDEIGDMPLDMQAKLLRVLQEGEIRPVGGSKTLHVDVRVLAATNKDLRAMVAAGEFREDLYFRLDVITITLPPLREREGDVELLVDHLLPGIAERAGRPDVRLSAEARTALCRWRWPGNVRELENELQRAVALTSGTIELADLSDAVAGRR